MSRSARVLATLLVTGLALAYILWKVNVGEALSTILERFGLQLRAGQDKLVDSCRHADGGCRARIGGIGVGQGEVLKLNDYSGFHPRMTGFKSLFDQGRLAILQGIKSAGAMQARAPMASISRRASSRRSRPRAIRPTS